MATPTAAAAAADQRESAAGGPDRSPNDGPAPAVDGPALTAALLRDFCASHSLSSAALLSLQAQFSRTPGRLLAQLSEQQIWARMSQANDSRRRDEAAGAGAGTDSDGAGARAPAADWFDLELAQLLFLHIRELGPAPAAAGHDTALSGSAGGAAAAGLITAAADCEPEPESDEDDGDDDADKGAASFDAEAAELARLPVPWHLRCCPAVARSPWLHVLSAFLLVALHYTSLGLDINALCRDAFDPWTYALDQCGANVHGDQQPGEGAVVGCEWRCELFFTFIMTAPNSDCPSSCANALAGRPDALAAVQSAFPLKRPPFVEGAGEWPSLNFTMSAAHIAADPTLCAAPHEFPPPPSSGSAFWRTTNAGAYTAMLDGFVDTDLSRLNDAILNRRRPPDRYFVNYSPDLAVEPLFNASVVLPLSRYRLQPWGDVSWMGDSCSCGYSVPAAFQPTPLRLNVADQIGMSVMIWYLTFSLIWTIIGKEVLKLIFFLIMFLRSATRHSWWILFCSKNICMLPFWCCYGRGYRRHYLNRPLDQNAGSVELRWNTCDFFFQTVPMLLINVSTIVGLYLQGTEAGISTVTKVTLAFNLLNFLFTVFSIFHACCGAAVETKQQLKQSTAQAKAARAPRRAHDHAASSPRARLQHQQQQPQQQVQVELQPLPVSPSAVAAPLEQPLSPAGSVSGSGPAPLTVPVDVDPARGDAEWVRRVSVRGRHSDAGSPELKIVM